MAPNLAADWLSSAPIAFKWLPCDFWESTSGHDMSSTTTSQLAIVQSRGRSCTSTLLADFRPPAFVL